jgi:hypothetical protein
LFFRILSCSPHSFIQSPGIRRLSLLIVASRLEVRLPRLGGGQPNKNAFGMTRSAISSLSVARSPPPPILSLEGLVIFRESYPIVSRFSDSTWHAVTFFLVLTRQNPIVQIDKNSRRIPRCLSTFLPSTADSAIGSDVEKSAVLRPTLNHIVTCRDGSRDEPPTIIRYTYTRTQIPPSQLTSNLNRSKLLPSTANDSQP